jgi:hypothetical protein
MTTPNEIDRIIRSLVRQTEEKQMRNAELRKECDQLKAQCESLIRMKWGLPPRRLNP